jgi:hypothetical protein
MTELPTTHAGLRTWAQGAYPTEAAVDLIFRAFNGLFAGPSNPWIQVGNAPGQYWLDAAQITDETTGVLSGESDGSSHLSRL